MEKSSPGSPSEMIFAPAGAERTSSRDARCSLATTESGSDSGTGGRSASSHGAPRKHRHHDQEAPRGDEGPADAEPGDQRRRGDRAHPEADVGYGEDDTEDASQKLVRNHALKNRVQRDILDAVSDADDCEQDERCGRIR